MPHHYRIDEHGLDRLGCVDECFTFGDARSAGGELNGIRTQPFRCKRKAIPGSGTILEKQIGNRAALEKI
jgi:hypothetical protein